MPRDHARPIRQQTSSGDRAPAQLGLPLRKQPTWGGARDGAGRKRGTRVQHLGRLVFARGLPTHLVLRVREGLPSLRQGASFQAIRAALSGLTSRPDFCVVHFSVLKNHLHLMVEATDAGALTRGAQALAIRIARGLNKALGRRGPVFADRYHARPLRTPREVRNALCYVLQNYRRHAAQEASRRGAIIDPTWLDPCSSAAAFDGWRNGPQPVPLTTTTPPVSAPSFWLLREGWRRHGLLEVDEIPPAAWK